MKLCLTVWTSILILTFSILVPSIDCQSTTIENMLSGISESEIYNTTYCLQNFTTRVYGKAGNLNAATYLYNKLDNISRLEVEYQSSYKNVIATLSGEEPASTTIYVVGAHYDSESSDSDNAPGCTDNGGGVGIVLELARVLSRYRFRHTLKFACWNCEEAGLLGSNNYAQYAHANGLNISLYFNYDSSCYDPENRLVLDIMYQASWVKDMAVECNTDYGIGFSLTFNVHTCTSDYIPFKNNGYTWVMTHSETHGTQYHTPNDTINKISSAYAKKNGQIGMSILATLAEVQGRVGDINGDGNVDSTDLSLLADSFGTSNITADLNKDGIIDAWDLWTLGKYYS